MEKRDEVQLQLCKSLGKEYRICWIDFEKVIYRDFGNGFNVEISGSHTSSTTKPVNIYLWHGAHQPSCFVVRTILKVPRDRIGTTVEELRQYADSLLQQGHTRESLWKMVQDRV